MSNFQYAEYIDEWNRLYFDENLTINQIHECDESGARVETIWYHVSDHPDYIPLAERSGSFEERFWSKVDRTDDGCWEWQATTSKGYGRFWVGDRTRPAHTVAYELTYDTTIPDGLHMRHLCHNPGCVRPSHLEPGAHAENMRDMVHANRQNSKLSREQVWEARCLNDREPAMTYREIKEALALPVTPNAVRNAVLGNTWNHVPQPYDSTAWPRDGE